MARRRGPARRRRYGHCELDACNGTAAFEENDFAPLSRDWAERHKPNAIPAADFAKSGVLVKC